MRTFHTGGVAGKDITQDLPRIQEIFEARKPNGQAVITEIDGVVAAINEGYDRQHEIVVQGVFRYTHVFSSVLHALEGYDK